MEKHFEKAFEEILKKYNETNGKNVTIEELKRDIDVFETKR